ncbi:MAG: S41 family peptidase [Ancalomicrobiaceae bacterium]|nr:S41 family peptidase [Ancalomicrobiaceae bacterium]
MLRFLTSSPAARRFGLLLSIALLISAATPVSSVEPGGDAVRPADPATFRRSEPADFSGLDRLEAFRRMHARLSAEYAFTDWKHIDWSVLFARSLPAIERAARDDDPKAFRAALRAYVSGIDDGHVNLPRNDAVAPLDDALLAERSGATFGLDLVGLDDGTVIVVRTTPDRPAARAGVPVGAEILRWNGRPIGEAVAAVDLGSLVAAARVATDVHRRLERLRLIGRAPVGSVVEVDLRGPGAMGEQRIRLTAESDAPEALAGLAPRLDPHEQAITVRRIGDHGYIRLTALADLSNLGAWPEAIWTAYATALGDFTTASVRGLVLDIRGNHGGWDLLAMRICGTLRRTSAFYEATEFYDAAAGGLRRLTVDDRSGEVVEVLTVEPEAPAFDGPVIALIDPMTISSAEGLARCVLGRPGGETLGHYATRGSFGLAGGEIRLPDGNVVHYPDGRAVDAAGTVLIDSRDGIGGVAPSIRIPVTAETALAEANGEDVLLAAALRRLDAAPPSSP